MGSSVMTLKVILQIPSELLGPVLISPITQKESVRIPVRAAYAQLPTT